MMAKSLGPSRRPNKKRRRGKCGSEDVPLSENRPRKHHKGDGPQRPDLVKHALLVQYFPRTLTLRQYILSKLPSSSRIRRKKIAAVGTVEGQARRPPEKGPAETELVLGALLDTTLVGVHSKEEDNKTQREQPSDRWQQWMAFSQKGDESNVTLSDGVADAAFSQAEVVDFVIWLLFSREKNPGSRPQNLLCDGFRKNVGPRHQGPPRTEANQIAGLFSAYPNGRVTCLKEDSWTHLLKLLGNSGERIMIDLLVDCSIFLAVEAGQQNYYQLSGIPLFESEPLSSKSASSEAAMPGRSGERKPTDIAFVRSRMLYARAALNARGTVHFGLRHIHALNRFPCTTFQESGGDVQAPSADAKLSKGADNSTRLMMYMFPRQFGLHNVFTSAVDSSKTAQKFQDYTLREDEISRKFRDPKQPGNILHVRIPKRLRGKLKHLVERLQVSHARCSYAAMMQHYCPVQRNGPVGRQASSRKQAPSKSARAFGSSSKGRGRSQQDHTTIDPLQYTSLTELATPISKVSTFCQAILSKIIPREFWGTGAVQSHNLDVFLRNIDHFVRLRRFEMMSLHEVLQGLRLTEIEWLSPPGLRNQMRSQTDFIKRTGIFSEFIYYLFDSVLIPLIRSNFYVSESNTHRYRLFFFRHDVWRSIAEPAMTILKAGMFEEVKLDDALRILESRRLGFSQVRLLPKLTSVRPVMNLRRRMLKSGGGTKVLGPSINSILGPVYNMLKLEKTLDPARLGCALFSVGDLYQRLKSFKQRHMGRDHGSFYIAKVDVHAAFDTIPQAAVIALMSTVPSQSRYQMVKHVEVRPNDNGAVGNGKPTKRWYSSAKAGRDASTFLQMIERETGPNKRNTVFVDSVVQMSHDPRALLDLMTSHIKQNLVKIGKKFYRQKNGIPQGSIISSVLCNYFYADLEKRRLQFLQPEDCLLLRLTDDFLLITTDKVKALEFVRVMQQGMPEYGVTVSPNKTLVNFDMVVGGAPVPRIGAGGHLFPYCGTQIDCRTLEITKDRGEATIIRDSAVVNSLTVEFSRVPGQNFKRKVINTFKIQSHLMYFDSSHNTPDTVLKNIFEAFIETATKTWAYMRCLPKGKQPGPRMVTATISDLIKIAFLLLKSKSRRLRYPNYQCAVTETQVTWLALRSFRQVLGKKQARYGEVLSWLDGEIARLDATKCSLRGVAV